MSHAQATQGIVNAVLAGVESIEHGIYLDEHVVDEMLARGTYLVATLIAPVSVIRLAEENPGSMPSWGVRKSKEVIEAHAASIRYAVERGVKIAMGTDTGVGVHGTNAGELALMVANGMTPMQAIVATTKMAAECSRFAAITGTIEPGKRADILALTQDPLADVSVLERPENLALIMKDGKAFKNALEARVGVGV
jgi:imidazolonepropionase-like amidohydrolase